MANGVKKLSDRSPFESYMDILDGDTVSSPDFLREGPNPEIENKPIDASRYYDQDFFNKEVNFLL